MIAQLPKPDPSIPIWVNVLFLALAFLLGAASFVNSYRSTHRSGRTDEFSAMTAAFKELHEQVVDDRNDTRAELARCEENCQACRTELAKIRDDHHREVNVLRRRIVALEQGGAVEP